MNVILLNTDAGEEHLGGHTRPHTHILGLIAGVDRLSHTDLHLNFPPCQSRCREVGGPGMKEGGRGPGGEGPLTSVLTLPLPRFLCLPLCLTSFILCSHSSGSSSPLTPPPPSPSPSKTNVNQMSLQKTRFSFVIGCDYEKR